MSLSYIEITLRCLPAITGKAGLGGFREQAGSLLPPPGHDPDRRPRCTRLPGPDVLTGLTAEIPVVPGLPDVEPERAAARALRDKGRRQVGGQVRRGHPLGARTRRGRRPLSRVPPGRVRRRRVPRRRRRQQLDHGLVPGGRAAAPPPVGFGRRRGGGRHRGGRRCLSGPAPPGGAGRDTRAEVLLRRFAGPNSGGRAGDRNTARTAMPPATTDTITATVSEACTRVAAARPPISAAAITSSAQPSWAGPVGDGSAAAACDLRAGIRGRRRPWALTGPPGGAAGSAGTSPAGAPRRRRPRSRSSPPARAWSGPRCPSRSAG